MAAGHVVGTWMSFHMISFQFVYLVSVINNSGGPHKECTRPSLLLPMGESDVDNLVGFLVRRDGKSRGVGRREGLATEDFLEEESQRGGRIGSGKTGRDRKLVQTRQQQIIWQMLKQCLIQVRHGTIIQTRVRIPGPSFLAM